MKSSSPFSTELTLLSARLAEISHNLLKISLSPSVPASLRDIPTKYNIIVCLWIYGFHKLLESLRRAFFSSPLALGVFVLHQVTRRANFEQLSTWVVRSLAKYWMAMVGGGVGAGGLGG